MTSMPPESRSPGAADGDWDDDRLRAAFLARAATAPSPPADLALETVARLDKPRQGFRWPALAAAGAAVALVALLGAGAALRPLQSGPSGTPGLTTGDPSATASTDDVLDAIRDPIDVAAALSVRDGSSGDRDREIQVKGFLSPLFALPCPMNLETSNPTHVRCPESFQYVMEDPEPLAMSSAGGFDLRPPVGPSFQPSFALVEPPLAPAGGDVGGSPVPVVVLGHFHDRRAVLCAPADRATCEGTFVVDRVVEVAGTAIPVKTIARTDAAPKDIEADVDALVGHVASKAIVESRRLVPIGEVIPLEPILTDDQVIPYVANPRTIAWIITTADLVEGTPRARTFLLLDGSNWFAEVTADGAALLGRVLPTPAGSEQPGPTEPQPVATFEIADQGSPTNVVRVLDYTGTIVAAVWAPPSFDGPWRDVPGNPQIMKVGRGAEPNDVVVRWDGPACSLTHTWRVEVRLLADRSVLISPYPDGPECEGVSARGHVVVLSFDAPVDLDRIIGEFCCG